MNGVRTMHREVQSRRLSSVGRRLTGTRLVAVLGITWMSVFWGHELWGQENQVPKGTQNDALGNLSKSVGFNHDRELEDVIDEIAQNAADADWANAARRLQQLFESPRHSIVLHEGVFRSAPFQATEIFRQWPQEAQIAYQRLAEPQAGELLRSAIRNCSDEGLFDVARRFRLTPSGQQALKLISQRQADLGLVELADVTRLELEHLTATSQRQPPTESTRLGEHPPPDFLRQEFPSRFPEWSKETPLPEESRSVLSSTHYQLRQSGLDPFLSLSLKRDNDAIIVTGATHRFALNPATGEELWKRPVQGYAAGWIAEPGSLSDANRRRLFAMSGAARIFHDSLHSEMVVENGRCYFLQREPIPAKEAEELWQSTAPSNRLVCVDVRTGDEIWSTKSRKGERQFYRGVPAIAGHRLYLVMETEESEELLLQIRSTDDGRLLRALPLALPMRSLAEDSMRHDVNCSVMVDGPRLICPTAGGAVIAVSVPFEEIAWACRYPRTDAVLLHSEAERQRIYQSGFQWWDAWQSVQLIPAEDRLVVATPESSLLMMLNRQTGETLWAEERSGALTIAAADPEHGVVVLEKAFARCLSWQSGDLQWRVSIPQPAGRGIRAGSSYVFPVEDQGTARLRLADGHLERSFAPGHRFPEGQGVLAHQVTPRHLVQAGETVFQLGLDGIAKLQSPREAQQAAVLAPLEKIFNAVERGDSQDSLTRLQGLRQSGEQSMVLRRGLLSLLETASRQHSSSGSHNDISRRILDLTTSPRERARWRQLQAMRCIDHQDWPRLIGLWVECPLEESQVSLPLPEDDSRCRLDRWFQAEIRQLDESADDAGRIALGKLITSRLPEPETVSRSEWKRLSTLLGTTRWGARWFLEHQPSLDDVGDRMEYVLRLLVIRESSDPELSAGATWRLYEHALEREDAAGAAEWLEQLSWFSPETALPGGRTVAGVLEEHGPTPVLGWPATRPVASAHSSWSTDFYFYPIHIHAQPESMYSRMHVEIEYPGHRAIRFNNSNWNQPWFCSLPKTLRNLRHFPELTRGWGFDQFLVLQCGSEIYGISPFEMNGDRGGHVVWPSHDESIDTLGDRDNLMLSFLEDHLPERPGFTAPTLQRLDEFQHRATAVEPVRPGYFCVQQFGMLVAFDPGSGKELWRRYDLPRRARCFGDADRLAVASPEWNDIRVYSATNGRLLKTVTVSLSLDDILGSDGLEVLLAHGDRVAYHAEEIPADGQTAGAGTRVELEFIDLASGEQVWQRDWKAGTLPFNLTGAALGMLTPSGKMEIIDSASGTTLAEHQVNVPESIERIVAAVGEQSVLVVLSGEVTDPQLLAAPRVHGGFRQPFVNGPVLGLDRETWKMTWQASLDDSIFPLDQPPDLPVFVTSEGRLPAKPDDMAQGKAARGTESGGGRLSCFDRRTGELLISLELESYKAPNYSILGSRGQQQIKLYTSRKRIEIDFSRSLIEPARNSDVLQETREAPPK